MSFKFEEDLELEKEKKKIEVSGGKEKIYWKVRFEYRQQNLETQHLSN